MLGPLIVLTLSSEPAREEFIFLPEITPVLMYLVLIPFGIIFAYGLYRRFRTYGLRNVISELGRERSSRVRGLVHYAFLQRKVVRKAFAGTVHLLLFSGTLVLLIGTLLVMLDYDFLRFFNAELLRGDFYLGYELILDVFGIAYVTGVILALTRRIVIKPEYLPNKKEYFTILTALLYLGITGYIMEGLRLALTTPYWAEWSIVGYSVSLGLAGVPQGLGSMVYGALWWSHAIVTFSLVAYLPYSSLMHIVLSSLSVIINSPRLSGKLSTPFNLAQLVESGTLDVRVGAKTLQDFSWRQLLSLDACTNCGRCQEECPAYASGTVLSPRRLVQNLREQLQNKDKQLFDSVVSEDEVWACTTCGACIEACPVLINPLEHIIDLRRHLVASGKLDKKKITLLNNLAGSSNPYGLPASDRQLLARDLGVRTLKEEPDAEYLYWIGCASTYDSRARDIAKAVVKILKKAGVSFAVLGMEERCNGDPARRIGEEGRFQELALHNIETLKRYNVRKIITHCPHCFNTLANEYPEFEGRFEVVHHSVLIQRLVEEGRIRVTKEVREKITLHDSCYLGRFNSIYDSPRATLRSINGVQMKEMDRTREKSSCCGAGGANYWFDVPKKERISVIRLREASKTEASTLAVECPYCLQMFSDAARITGLEDKMKVRDIAEIVADSMD